MSSILFENKNDFDILLIKESDINLLDWKDPEYIKKICNQDIYTVITTNPENFLKDIHSNLKSNENINLVSEKFNIELETQIICELKEYTYELLGPVAPAPVPAYTNNSPPVIRTNSPIFPPVAITVFKPV